MTEEAGSSMSTNVDELENSGQGVDPGSGDESRAAEESNGAAATESESPGDASASGEAERVSDTDNADDAADAADANDAEDANVLDGPEDSPESGDPDAPSEVDVDSVADSDSDADPDTDSEADSGEDDGDSDDDGDADSEEDADESDPAESEAERVSRLEREGDVAADYLEELLDIADVDGDIDLDIESDRALVAIVGGRLQRLVGRDGEVLEALQELARLAVLRETGVRSRLMLDIDGHRARRRGELVSLAEKVAAQVKESGKPVRLDPMSPFERKIVHDTVAAKGLTSESEGEEPERRVVVQPA